MLMTQPWDRRAASRRPGLCGSWAEAAARLLRILVMCSSVLVTGPARDLPAASSSHQ